MKYLALAASLTSGLAVGCGGGLPAPDEDSIARLVDHGRVVYANADCASCHGPADGSEVPPEHDAPRLSGFVARFGLTDAAVDPALEWIRSGALHDTSRDEERPFEGFEQFVVAARLYEDLIVGGTRHELIARIGLADPMPDWGGALSERDLDALLVYLISAQR